MAKLSLPGKLGLLSICLVAVIAFRPVAHAGLEGNSNGLLPDKIDHSKEEPKHNNVVPSVQPGQLDRSLLPPVITCPADATIQCHESTLPDNAGLPVVSGGCPGELVVTYGDYTDEPPGSAPEMRWDYLPPGSSYGDCYSASDCSTGLLCFGLVYTPGVSGTLVSYTTGFYVDCVSGNNPVTYNASCVMTDNSAEFDICASDGEIFMNSSGNSGVLDVQKHVPVIIHQVCLQLGPGSSINIEEDPVTDLTTTIEVLGEGSFDEAPDYATYQRTFDEFCDVGCPFAGAFYRKFIVTDECGEESTCVQHITIEDTTPPEITCPSDITVAVAASTLPDDTGYPDFFDNCDPEATFAYEDSVFSTACAPIGGVYRTWMAFDICGNQSSCTQYIEVSETFPPDAAITPVASPVCYYNNVLFSSANPQVPGFNYVWTFGAGAVPASLTGYGPHQVYYTTSGTKTIKLVMDPADPSLDCADSTTINLAVTLCAGQILGFVKTNDGEPLVNVNLRLFADANADGAADTTAYVRNVFTNSSGFYAMASLIPGHYVIIQTQPNNYTTVDDFDASNDNDAVANISILDNLIPVTIGNSEIDSMNNFIEAIVPANITGTVFIDNNFNLLPDEYEGLAGVSLRLLPDYNTDGVADNNTPVATAVTSANGSFSIPDLPLADYVLVETNPSGYLSVRDYDSTPDGDDVSNSNNNNDTIPVSLYNNEPDANNYFIDAAICGRVVTSLFDAGYGTLRYNIDCAEAGDTITFHPSLAGLTINITSDELFLVRDVNIFSSLTPQVTISSAVNGLFTIPAATTAVLKNLQLVSGLTSGDIGAAIDNAGILTLENVQTIRNPLSPPGVRQIWNRNTSQLTLTGTCLIKEIQ